MKFEIAPGQKDLLKECGMVRYLDIYVHDGCKIQGTFKTNEIYFTTLITSLPLFDRLITKYLPALSDEVFQFNLVLELPGTPE